MRVDLPGLLRERMPSGQYRYRVRVAGDKTRRIALHIGPDHADFLQHYRAARNGVEFPRGAAPADTVPPQSVSWLSLAFEAHMQARVSAGLMHPGTAHQRAAFYARLRGEYGAKHMAMPRSAVVKLRDKMTATPGAADNMVKAIRALYTWARDQGHVTENPAAGIGTINRGKGATPWTLDDLAQFRARHPQGTMAHLALSLFAFTGCRIEDATILGPRHIITRDGAASLHWQPGKRGSAPVTVPILPQLQRAIAAHPAKGSAFLLTAHGQPFASGAALGNKFRAWVAEAGLADRSPHGIRKALAGLLAGMGASQYEIMAILAHTSAKTSEIYTRGADRAGLAAGAMQRMAGLDW